MLPKKILERLGGLLPKKSLPLTASAILNLFNTDTVSAQTPDYITVPADEQRVEYMEKAGHPQKILPSVKFGIPLEELEKYCPKVEDFHMLENTHGSCQNLGRDCYGYAFNILLQAYDKPEVSQSAIWYTMVKRQLDILQSQVNDSVVSPRRFIDDNNVAAILTDAEKYGMRPQEAFVQKNNDSVYHYSHSTRDKINTKVVSLKESRASLSIEERNIIIDECISILDNEFGQPPTTFIHQGKEYTPHSFFESLEVSQLTSYISRINHEFSNTLKVPNTPHTSQTQADLWYAGSFEDSSFINKPITEIMDEVIKQVKNRKPVMVEFDTHEAGASTFEGKNIFYIPKRDFNKDNMNKEQIQSARESRLINGTTSANHTITLVGCTKHNGEVWFIARDSGLGAHRRNNTNPGITMISSNYLMMKGIEFSFISGTKK